VVAARGSFKQAIRVLHEQLAGQQARLVAGDRRCLAGRGKKGGEKVARTLRGSPAALPPSRRRGGLPLAIALSAGNENGAALPCCRCWSASPRPDPSAQLWADRGYARARTSVRWPSAGSAPHQPAPPARAARSRPDRRATVWRERKRRLKTHDPQGPPSLPVERTNAWLKAKRRIATRRDRKADNYLAFLDWDDRHLVRSFWKISSSP